MRKTIPVNDIRRHYQSIAEFSHMDTDLQNSIDAQLKGASCILQSVLMTTGQYKGFGYINRLGQFIGTDHPDFTEHRRRYY